MARRMSAAVMLRRRLPVKQGPLDVHAEFAHLLESLGSDKVLPLTIGFVFLDPLQLLCRFDKYASDGKRIDWPQTVVVFALGFYLAPLVVDGKILLSSLLAFVQVSVKDLPALVQQQAIASGRKGYPATLLQKSNSHRKFPLYPPRAWPGGGFFQPTVYPGKRLAAARA
jgi:hypothetical protein